MARWYKTGALALGLGLAPWIGAGPAWAQNFERDTTITGPRGRSLTRQVDINRGPNGVSRDISITRPGGATFHRDSFVGRPAGGFPHGGGGFGRWAPAPRFGGPVFIGGGGGGGGIGPWGAGLLGGALGLGAGALIGSAVASNNNPPPPPPPQTVVVEQPVVVAQPGQVVVTQPAPPPAVVEYVPPVRYQPQAPQTVVVDPVGQEIARLQSSYEGTRRDAVMILGRMGDNRAVAPLVDRLKNDPSKNVRIAAATSLGQIGDPGAAIYLQRSVIYDKRQDVRDASTAALARLPRQTQAPAVLQAGATVSQPSGAIATGPVPTNRVPTLQPDPDENVPPPPTPAGSSR